MLALVPGFDFGQDTNGVTGPSFRGIWGYEGKILLLWDGIEMNETFFGNIPLGNHFPVDQIQRVEIIRGPGSAMYGGFAEVAVIKVTTLQAEDLKGVAGGLAYGRGSDTALTVQAHAMYGWSQDGTSFSIGVFGGTGDRSDQHLTDSTGLTYPMAGNSAEKPFMVNLSLKTGDFQLRAISDHYEEYERSNFGLASLQAVLQRFTSNDLDLRYVWKLADIFTLTPYVVYRDQKPWYIEAQAPQVGTLMAYAVREKAGLQAAWQPSLAWAVQFGYEFTKDHSGTNPLSSPPFNVYTNGTTSISYNDSAVFSQVEYQGTVNLTLGARYEHHSEAGDAFVPRFALTKTVGKWNFKALAAESYRTPSIFNLNDPLYPGSPITPEKTTSYELEVGYQIGTGVISANVYDMRVNRPLVFTVVSQTALGYFNQASVEAKGIEAQYQVRTTWGFLTASIDTRTMDNLVQTWAVPGRTDDSLGFPNTHATLLAGIKLGDGWSFNPTLRYLGSEFGFNYSSQAQGMVLIQRGPQVVADGNVAYTNGVVTASIGLFDITNREVPFIQPYNGGNGFLPGQGREVLLKLKYGF